jgi:16S rRNA (cytosine967-C5)-methyltransferase
MHPKVLLDACAELVRLTLTFEHPADAVVSRFFRDNRGLGPRERATLAETVYTVLRKKLLFDHLAPSGSGPKERRLAILGFHGPRDFSEERADRAGKELAGPVRRHQGCRPDGAPPPQPARMAGTAPQGPAGREFWPLVESLAQNAPLDLRVNVLTAKRAEVQKELAGLAIKSAVDAVFPMGPAH